MVNSAKIGRFDGVLNPVVFNDGQTINDLLSKASLVVGSGEVVKNESDVTQDINDEAVDGETYFVVSNLKQG